MNADENSSPAKNSEDVRFFTRPTDPDESHLAAGTVDVGGDRKECFELFSQLIANGEHYATRKVFEYEFLISLGRSAARADSLTRRMSDIVVRKTNPFPQELHLLCPTGERFDASAILTHTERGKLALSDPSIMAKFWGYRKKRKPKKKKTMGIPPEKLSKKQWDMIDEPDRPAAALMSEAQMHNGFASWLHGYKLGFYHANPTRESTIAPGTPDFGVYRKSWIIFIEFKAGRNDLTDVQKEKIHDMIADGNAVFVCRELSDAKELVTKFFHLQ